MTGAGTRAGHGAPRAQPEEPAIMDVVTFSPGQMGPGRVEVVWTRKLSPDEVSTTTLTSRERVEQLTNQ